MNDLPALELLQITKRYGALAANHNATVRIKRGSIHAIVGENGAGKSTLLKIAYGSVRADSGRIVIRGKDIERDHHAPRQAILQGLGMVHQHFMLVPTLTALENAALGVEGGFLLDLAPTRRAVAELGESLCLGVDPDRLVSELSIGEQQRVEILKTLLRGADTLLLDEPTAVLSPPEVKDLLRVMRALAEKGKTVILVSHRLDEVQAIADRITVMRRGEVVAEFDQGVTSQVIARAMVGRDLVPVRREPGHEERTTEILLEVKDLSVSGRGGTNAVRRVSFSVRAGEIFGIAGVQGNGQSELVLALAGLIPQRSGAVHLGGEEITRATPRRRMELGMAHVPGDRHKRGLLLDASLLENLILGRQHEFSSGWRMDKGKMAAFAAARLTELDIRPAHPETLAGALSGGNQQKVVLARELSRSGLRVLICAEPTRGVDVGATEVIHRQLLTARDRGVAVVLVSSELSELRALSDRLGVMFRGELCAVLPPGVDDDTLGAFMTGARVKGASEAAEGGST